MSTTFASDDGWEPVVGLGPSPARAFLHALVAKLHRLATHARAIAQRIAHVARSMAGTVIEIAASAISAVVARRGIQAAASIVVAAGQVVGHLARQAIAATGSLLRRAAVEVGTRVQAVTSHPVVRDLTTRLVGWGRQSWVVTAIVALVLTAVLVAGVISLRLLHAEPLFGDADNTATVTWGLDPNMAEQVRTGLFVILGQDGSVRVHGIPQGLPDTARARLAQAAARAAEQRLESLVARGRPLSPLDLQAINVAARSAVAQVLDTLKAA
jgi:hypothetical protein